MRFWGGAQGGARKGRDNSGMNPNDGACRMGALHGLEAQFYAAISDASPAFDMSCETSADGGVPQYVPHNSLTITEPPVPARVFRHRFRTSISNFDGPPSTVLGLCRAREAIASRSASASTCHPFRISLRSLHLLLTCPSLRGGRSCTGNTCGECFAVQVRHRLFRLLPPLFLRACTL